MTPMQLRSSRTTLDRIVLVAALLTLPTQARAQVPEFPTFRDLGLEYISDSGFTQILLSGQFDVEGFYVANSWEPSTVEPVNCDACHIDVAREFQQGDGGAHLQRLRVFADLFVGDHVYGLVELRGDKGRERFDGDLRARIEQLFLRLTTGSGTEGVQVGRFASPFGAYAQRHLSVADPFLSAPLPYDYRTVMNRWRWPGSDAAFLTWKDQPEDIDIPGAPPVWDVPYQWGAMVFGSVGPLELRAAAMNSAPSSHPNAWSLSDGQFERPSWVFAGRWKATSSLEVGASYDRGPWLGRRTPNVTVTPPDRPSGPPPNDRTDFDQELISFDVAVARGPVMIRAEVIRDTWEVPNMEAAPASVSGTVELQTDLAAGFFVAGRAGMINFRPIDDGQGSREDWDYDVYRYEGALGYRLSQNVGLLLSGYRQVQTVQQDGDTEFVGLRMWWGL
jgi:hypothetical protein